MTIQSTQLYDSQHDPIYPITRAGDTIIDIETEHPGGGGSPDNPDHSNTSNVDEVIRDLYKRIAALEGAEEAVTSLQVKVSYVGSTISDVAEIKSKDKELSWAEYYIPPTENAPYAWKKTIYTYKGLNTEAKDLNVTYEIIATNITEKYETIYISTSTSEQPIIKYDYLTNSHGLLIKPNGEVIKDKEGKPLTPLSNIPDDILVYYDYSKYDDHYPKGWSDEPTSISPATPYAFIATRHKNTPDQIKEKQVGKWSKFSNPAQYGRWAFDSTMVMRYQKTPSLSRPQANIQDDNPGELWLSEPPVDTGAGALWMVVATSVNGIYNKNEQGNKWQGPLLISVIQ